MGVNKSADVCIVYFAVGRKGVGFIVFISENAMDHSCSEVHCKRENHKSC